MSRAFNNSPHFDGERIDMDKTRSFHPAIPPEMDEKIKIANAHLKTVMESPVPSGLTMRQATEIGSRLAVCIGLIEGTMSVENNRITLATEHDGR